MPDFGDGSPREEYGAANPNDPRLSPEQYAEYQQKRKRAFILGLLGTIGGASALGFAGNALGGAGAASASVPGAVGAEAAPLGVGSVTASGALPSGIGLSNAAVGAGTAAGAGASASAAGAGAGAAGGAAKGILGGLTARDIAALGLTGGSMIGSAMQDRPNMSPTTATSDPNLMKLIQAMQGRLDKSEPLYDSILSMANGLLPTQYQKGGGGMA